MSTTVELDLPKGLTKKVKFLKTELPYVKEEISAYDLCTAVCKVILDESKRFNMGIWTGLEGGRFAGVVEAQKPPCGTVGCFAGWVTLLTRGRRSPAWVNEFTHLQYIAAEVLGVGPKKGLWWGTAEVDGSINEELNDGYGDSIFGFCPIGEPGTRKYAASAVRIIRKWQKKHADVLKAKIVRPNEAENAVRRLQRRGIETE